MLAYAPVLHGKFLWDDLYLVGANPFFKSPRFILEVFRHYLFLDSFSLYYRPVQNLSYILDYAIWNRNEFGYHLSNILFHAASAFLLFLVLRRCLRAMPANGGRIRRRFARTALRRLRVGLLWAVHPIHNAAVAYVSGRADSIAMMFALAAWLLFFNGGTGWRAGLALALAALCVLAALCAKEIAFIWIALFAIYLFGFERRLTLRTKLCGDRGLAARNFWRVSLAAASAGAARGRRRGDLSADGGPRHPDAAGAGRLHEPDFLPGQSAHGARRSGTRRIT